MLRVGLTGSIAVGKSFVSTVFSELGARVMDADQIAREVVAPGSVGLSFIVETFGDKMLSSDGTLDRVRLGEIVFNDSAKRELLNSLLHPLIMRAQDERFAHWQESEPNGVGIVDAALLIESGGYRRLQKIVVVFCEAETQLERLMRRNNISRDVAIRRIEAQMSQEEKKRYADFLIDTTNGFEDTRRQVIEIYGKLKDLMSHGVEIIT